MIRWTLPAEPRKHDRRRMLREEIRPLLALSSFVSLGAEYYVGQYHSPAHDVSSQVKLTLTLSCDRVNDSRRIVGQELPKPSSVDEIPSDRILQADCDWYRRALQCLTDIALDVLSSWEAPPVEEPSWGDPASEALIAELHHWLTQHSTSYGALGDLQAFWGGFFRWGPSEELSPPGHWLWNIAG